MAGNEGERWLHRPVAVGRTQIGVAYAARLGFHQDFAGSRGGNFQFQKFQGFSELLDNRSMHFGRHVQLLFSLSSISSSLPAGKFVLINGVVVFLSQERYR
jgi:hypothetical protein